MLWKTWDQLLFRPLPRLRSREDLANRTLRDSRFNPKLLTMSSASLVPVEKSGRDFHRVALPSRLKSTIRSIPKSGSDAIRLLRSQVQRLVGSIGAICTGSIPEPLTWLLPGGECSKALWTSQGTEPTDKVI